MQQQSSSRNTHKQLKDSGSYWDRLQQLYDQSEYAQRRRERYMQVREQAEQLSQQHQIGAYRGHYPDQSGYPFNETLFYWQGFVLALTVIVSILTHYQLISNGPFFIVLLSGINVILLLFQLKIATSLPPTKNITYIYADGLIKTEETGKETALHWDEVKEVWQQESHYTAYNGTYVASYDIFDGYRIVYGNDKTLWLLYGFNGVRLYRKMLNAFAYHFLPRARTTYEAGQEVDFKLIRISKQGIHYGKRVLPWAELHKIETTFLPNSRIKIYKVGQKYEWANIGAKTIPNADALQRLVIELQEQHNNA